MKMYGKDSILSELRNVLMDYLVNGAGHMEAYSKDKDKYKKVVKEFLDSIC